VVDLDQLLQELAGAAMRPGHPTAAAEALAPDSALADTAT
jgi:hypothetical protein